MTLYGKSTTGVIIDDVDATPIMCNTSLDLTFKLPPGFLEQFQRDVVVAVERQTRTKGPPRNRKSDRWAR